MNHPQTHIIRRQNVKVNASTHDAFALKRKIELLMDDLTPKLGKLFDGLVSEKEWLQIDTLDIVIDDVPEKDFEDNLTERILQNIAEKISGLAFNKTSDVNYLNVVNQLINQSELIFEALLYFLENGFLSWRFQVLTHDEFERELHLLFKESVKLEFISVKLSARLYAVLSASDSRKRLVDQFGSEVYWGVIDLIASSKNISTVELQKLFERLSKVFTSKQTIVADKIAVVQSQHSIGNKILQEAKSRVIAQLIKCSNADEVIGNLLLEVYYSLESEPLKILQLHIVKDSILKQYLPERALNTSMDYLFDRNQINKSELLNDSLGDLISGDQKVKRDAFISEIKKENGAIISNAGLIIIAPFLPELFKQRAVSEDGVLTDPNKAIALLHYTTFGNCSYREYDVLFNKVLCGLEANKPIEILYELSTEDKNEIDTMLETAVNYWDVLKNTSPDGLREGFLQRNGTLNHKYDDWFLQVEQNPIDALLQHLPWTIGFVKLPWMGMMIRTAWV